MCGYVLGVCVWAWMFVSVFAGCVWLWMYMDAQVCFPSRRTPKANENSPLHRNHSHEGIYTQSKILSAGHMNNF